MPKNKLTLGATALENVLTSAKVTRNENGFDIATIVLPDTSYYPGTVTQGTTVSLEVKEQGGSYTTIFVGIARFVIADIEKQNSLTISCLGIGAGLNEMLVATEYGAQTSAGLDTLTDIVTDATYGIIPNYVQKIFGGSDSNYDFDTTNVETINDTINYINFPYKPADKSLNDLCDLVTALRAGSSGPHWITTYASGTNYLRIKYTDGTQTGWTKYYGDSQENATLTYGVDYTQINLEKLAPEANYIVHYGAWRRPSDGDAWTYGSGWDVDPGLGNLAIESESTIKIVGSTSLRIFADGVDSTGSAWYPSAQDADWDFTIFNQFNMPNLNFYAYRDTDCNIASVYLYDDVGGGKYYSYTLYNGSASDPLGTAEEWTHISLPVGTYYNTDKSATQKWTPNGAPSGWGNIKCVLFFVAATADNALYIDGLHFGGASVCRVAALSSYVGEIVRQKLIVDDVGKDDSLLASDDSGVMAQLAYSELLRQQTTSTVGYVKTPMIKDLLPGQWLYIQSTDYRVTKMVHTISNDDSYTSEISVTSDTINSRPRLRFEDLNKQYANLRPEWQDRQASNMKAGSVDWRVTRLVKTY
jgi:hypothetical protein